MVIKSFAEPIFTTAFTVILYSQRNGQAALMMMMTMKDESTLAWR